MQKLSLNQKELLKFFADGGIVEFCTTVGSQLGTTTFPSKRPRQFHLTVFNSLMKFGLVQAAGEAFQYGFRWSSVVISERGAQTVASWEDSHETL
ncbi:hypothetical protein J3369_00260 [Alteromonas sp. NFXS44]|uniref:hypothetical protein n=1 Tax=Alteromonas sp. NFXS44 TaxID=2818435 RepID=UPI0032DEF944